MIQVIPGEQRPLTEEEKRDLLAWVLTPNGEAAHG